MNTKAEDFKSMKNEDGTLKCFGHKDIWQGNRPHLRHCIAMQDELNYCNTALERECEKAGKINNI